MTRPEPTISPGFTLAAVGDCIVSRPLANSAGRVPRFDEAITLLHQADAAFGNLETTIADLREVPDAHPHGIPEDWAVLAPPSVAADLRSLGVGLVGRANNHSMDWGPAGMRETSRLLDAAGVAHAGTGEHLASARAPRYMETSHGRIALVSVTTTPGGDAAAALAPHGEVPGRPGVNTIRVTARVSAPPDAMLALRALRDAFPEADTSWVPIPKEEEASGHELELFRTRFVLSDEFEVAYDFDESDVRANLHAIRLGAQHADLAFVAIHAHQGDHGPHRPPDGLRRFARAAIDEGAAAVIVSGPHRICPIELHDGRPIFYGLGDFIWSDIQEPLQGYFYERSRRVLEDEFSGQELVTDADLLRVLNAKVFSSEQIFQAVVAVARFEGEAMQIRLHPMELGQGEPLTTSGVPRTASDVRAAEILERLATMSAPFGTSIVNENGVGIVGSAG
jgi:poly-gamma-glutamate capsule biosynthesis protein CapA/YwtB (metallophosphatase superfamily)